jgi:hypothetical protein
LYFEFKTFDNVIRNLKKNGKSIVPADYEALFVKAKLTFAF